MSSTFNMGISSFSLASLCHSNYHTVIFCFLPTPDSKLQAIWCRNCAFVLVCYNCHNKIPQTGWLKHRNLFSSQFWWLEVWDQGVGRFGFFWGLSPWLVGSHLLCVLISSYKDTSHIGSGPAEWPYFTLTATLESLSPNRVTFWDTAA